MLVSYLHKDELSRLWSGRNRTSNSTNFETSPDLSREFSLRAVQHNIDKLLVSRHRGDILPSRLHRGQLCGGKTSRICPSNNATMRRGKRWDMVNLTFTHTLQGGEFFFSFCKDEVGASKVGLHLSIPSFFAAHVTRQHVDAEK
jgi:hypothetical protein